MLLSNKALAKKGRGASQKVVCNEKKLAVVKWYDNKVVTLVSSFVDPKETKTRVDVDCPQIVTHVSVIISL